MVEPSSEPSSWKSIPGFAKTFMVVETFLVFFLSFWIYQEYENNLYLQAYVNSYLQGSTFSFLALASIGVFSLAGVLVFARLRRSQRELQTTLIVEHGVPSNAASSGYLDRRTEQQLIDLIRKQGPPEKNTQQDTGNSMNTTSSGDGANSAAMPVLKKEDPPPTPSGKPKTN